MTLETIDFKELELGEHIRLYAILSNENRIQILFALYHNPPSANWMLSFNRLKTVLKMSAPSLSHHLKILQNHDLIENILVREEDGSFSQYRLTEKGSRVVKKMLSDLDEGFPSS